MFALRAPHIPRTLLLGAIASIVIAIPATASLGSIDPELERQEAEVERLLKSAEAEFWSLNDRIDRERNDRQVRLAQAKADYEKAQASLGTSTSGRKSAKVDVASSKAERALEKYQTELEQALTGVSSARTELERVEARVSQYRTALEAIRRRSVSKQQVPGSCKPSAVPDTSSVRTPITSSLDPALHLMG